MNKHNATTTTPELTPTKPFDDKKSESSINTNELTDMERSEDQND